MCQLPVFGAFQDQKLPLFYGACVWFFYYYFLLGKKEMQNSISDELLKDCVTMAFMPNGSVHHLRSQTLVL